MLALALIFSLLLNFFVPLSSAQENTFTVENDNSAPPDNWLFTPLENSPGENPGPHENENGFYGLQIMYFENATRYESVVVEQEIKPGEELSHPFSITRNPDGTYFIEAEQGMNVLSLEAWRSAIDNIPDNVFIKNPAQRKQALKEKFEEVFEEIHGDDEGDEDDDEGDGVEEIVEDYQEAIEKLEHDILKKLDADGQADWTTEPVLVDEIKSLIAILKRKMPAGGGD